MAAKRLHIHAMPWALLAVAVSGAAMVSAASTHRVVQPGTAALFRPVVRIEPGAFGVADLSFNRLAEPPSTPPAADQQPVPSIGNDATGPAYQVIRPGISANTAAKAATSIVLRQVLDAAVPPPPTPKR